MYLITYSIISDIVKVLQTGEKLKPSMVSTIRAYFVTGHIDYLVKIGAAVQNLPHCKLY